MLYQLLSLVACLLGTVQGQTTTTLGFSIPTGTTIPGDYNGALRPQVHYSPPAGFMNDSNGMFLDADGIYYLYYQYNPNATIAGNVY